VINMLLFQNVHYLAIGRRARVDGMVLFNCLAKGSGDSFAPHDHGMKSILPGNFPGRSFSTDCALKDLAYALALVGESGIAATRAASPAAEYFPAIIEVGERDTC